MESKQDGPSRPEFMFRKLPAGTKLLSGPAGARESESRGIIGEPTTVRVVRGFDHENHDGEISALVILPTGEQRWVKKIKGEDGKWHFSKSES
ncbi:MAG: hypothetical protein M1524_03310 [Patescibacteria group bacterium]|nr:hypothetical protein [Patescibacteria group bacterium]